jgi:hypothetical protein
VEWTCQRLAGHNPTPYVRGYWLSSSVLVQHAERNRKMHVVGQTINEFLLQRAIVIICNSAFVYDVEYLFIAVFDFHAFTQW